MKKEQKETYTIRVVCDNCGSNDTIKLPKGVEIDKAECPNCGCRTLSKRSLHTGELRPYEITC